MRRSSITRREPESDPRYGNKLVQKFINMIMRSGKQSTAEAIVYGAFEALKTRANTQDPLAVFQKAVENSRPLLEVKSRRVGGATYQVPIEVRHDRGTTLALRWIRDYARARKGAPMVKRLADELFEAYQGTGASVKKKEETHKMAEANRAFAHYRW